MTLQIVEQRLEPVIKRGDPGTEQIEHGIEGGVVLKLDSTYHLFTTEMIGERDSVKTRLAHWTSRNRLNWVRRSTLCESSGDFTGKDPRASLWAMPLAYDESARRWNFFYVAYRAKPNDDTGWNLNYEGRIWRAVSEVEGRDGLVGPYKDVGVVLEPGPQSQPWEGLQGTDSFHIYRAENRWVAFYGSAQTQLAPKPNPAFAKWNVGLAEAGTISGPWQRRQDGNPVLANGENPVVTRLASGRYLAIFDALRDSRGQVRPFVIGYADSRDGVQWSNPEYLELRQEEGFWLRDARTPLGMVEESDGSYSLFYTGHHKQDAPLQAGRKVERGKQPPFPCLGLVSVRLAENP